MQTKELELLGCPFCGHDQHCRAEVLTVDDDTLEPEDQEPIAWGVGCSCTAFVGPLSSEAEAIAAWNTRFPTSSGGRGEAWRPIESAPLGHDFLAVNSRGDMRRCWRYKPSSRTDEILSFSRNAKFAAVGWMPLPAPPTSNHAASAAANQNPENVQGEA